MTWRELLSRGRRFRLVALIVCGVAGGLVLTVLVLDDIDSFRASVSDAAKLAPVDYSQPAKIDPRAREVGYSIARASRIDRLASCNTLQPDFRPGCRAYVLEQARKARREPIAR